MAKKLIFSLMALAVLAEVEGREMEPEHPHLARETLDERGRTSSVGLEAVVNLLQVVEQLGIGAIGPARPPLGPPQALGDDA